MHLNQLLLTMAAPVAARSVSLAARGLSDVGSSFVQFLHRASQSPPDAAESVETRFEMMAKRIQSAVADEGIGLPFRLRIEASSDAPPEVTVGGPAAEQVAQWLQQRPEVVDELTAVAQELASAFATPDRLSPSRVVAEISDRAS
ncbi:MAG: hypothetical protein D6753_11440, partial [Planctomycetota bacterium]